MLGIDTSDLWVQAGAALAVGVAAAICARPFLLLSFDRDHCRAAGFNAGLYEWIMLGLVALTVVVSFQTVGTLLVFGMLLAPPRRRLVAVGGRDDGDRRMLASVGLRRSVLRSIRPAAAPDVLVEGACHRGDDRALGRGSRAGVRRGHVRDGPETRAWTGGGVRPARRGCRIDSTRRRGRCWRVVGTNGGQVDAGAHPAGCGRRGGEVRVLGAARDQPARSRTAAGATTRLRVP